MTAIAVVTTVGSKKAWRRLGACPGRCHGDWIEASVG